MIKKILFLDIDGVCNSEETFRKEPHQHFPIDPYMAFLVGKIQLETDCKVVLSSSWRHHKESIKEIEKRIVPIYDKTGSCCSGIRGVEIYSWISKNIPYQERDALKFAILDDDSDMLLWQKDSFFQTSWKVGLTDEIANNIIKHLNG